MNYEIGFLLGTIRTGIEERVRAPFSLGVFKTMRIKTVEVKGGFKK
jgi:hypothetical protein